MLPFIVWLLKLVESYKSVATLVTWILRIFCPTFCLGNGLLNIGNSELDARFFRDLSVTKRIGAWDAEF